MAMNQPKLPAYGSNIAGFNPNDPNQQKIAQLGQQWAQAQASGASQETLQGLHQQAEDIRNLMGGGSYNPATGVHTIAPQQSPTAGAGMSNADLINQLYAQQSQVGAGQYASQQEAAKQQAYQGMNVADVVAAQNQRSQAESMANLGLMPSGDYLSLQAAQNAQRQGAQGQVQSQLATQLQDITNQRQDYLNQTGAQRLQALVGDVYNQQQFGLQQAGLTGQYGGQDTMARQQQLAELTGRFQGAPTAQQAQQDWSNRFAYGQAVGQFAGAGGQQTLQAIEANRNYELQKQQQAATIANMTADNARANAAAARSAGNENQARLFDIWDRTGEAPAGLESMGVQQGQPLVAKPRAGSTGEVPYDQNPDWSDEISSINADAKGQRADLLAHSKEYISKYGYDGYQKLLSHADSLISKG